MNITYLLGAGASYNALPIIDELPSRLTFFESVVRNAKEAVSRTEPKDFKLIDLMERLAKDINFITQEILHHKTVDTLAKKYYVVTEDAHLLVCLKKVLIAYFLFEQTPNTSTKSHLLRTWKNERGDDVYQRKEIPDKRYDSFIASIINEERGNLSLNPKFKVVTWNYDVQFELAYQRYFPKERMGELDEKLQALPTYDFLEEKMKFDSKMFSVVRLNGVAGLSFLPLIQKIKRGSNGLVDFIDLVSVLAELHTEVVNENVPAFSYAWEKHEQLKTVHKNKQLLFLAAKEVLQTTNVLVVIGYSFPNFNRSVDLELFERLPALRKVYVQDTNADNVISLLRSSFPIFRQKNVTQVAANQVVSKYKVKIEPIQHVNQFFIPPEAEI